eukprot:gene2616-3576_t
MEKETKRGKVRVGTCKFQNKKRFDPTFKNYTPILVLTKNSEYGEIGPYCLKNKKGQVMENIWQFSKIYEKIPKVHQKFEKNIVWEFEEQNHLDKERKLNKKYWKWRNIGMNFPSAVRYPVGMKTRNECLGAIYNENDPLKNDTPFEYSNKYLDYIDSRKKIYAPVYIELVKMEKKFKELKERLENGENLLIIEVDGPKSESFDYYKEKYNVSNDFIESNTIEVNKENMKIMLNDSKHAFGHGYCLGIALLDAEEWLK